MRRDRFGNMVIGMQLKAYLVAADVTYDDFAKRIGASNAGVIAKYAAGKRVPHPKFMAAIVRETGGKVQPNDFYATEVV
ncbi:helix-turn-helix transcriptional regulator [Novosphingobium resinovorum]|uniref:helix-turn-helix domain-containing protein n=1 Tax=Novosphingobium resinovorum TaxID=158500 RepID=UPI002ECFE2BC